MNDPGGNVPVTLRDVVTSNAEGNPYFIEELVAMLIDDGAIVADGDRWHVAADKLVEVHIPSTLAGVLQARLDGLPSAEKMALQQASDLRRANQGDHCYHGRAVQTTLKQHGVQMIAQTREHAIVDREGDQQSPERRLTERPTHRRLSCEGWHALRGRCWRG